MRVLRGHLCKAVLSRVNLSQAHFESEQMTCVHYASIAYTVVKLDDHLFQMTVISTLMRM